MFSVLMAVLQGLPGEGFPSEDGARWSYQEGDEEALVLELSGVQEIRGIRTHRLRVRGYAAFLGERRALYLVQDRDGLREAAYAGSVSPDTLQSGSRTFLKFPLAEGQTWTSPHTPFAATVLKREFVSTAAGGFQAWKVGYVTKDCYGERADILAWFASEVGFVKVEETVKSKRRVLELASFLKHRPRSVAAPDLTPKELQDVGGLLRTLESESVDARVSAAEELRRMGRGVIPVLERSSKSARDAEVRSRLQDILLSFRPIECVARLKKPRIKVGERLPVQFRIHNVSSQTVQVLPSLDKSDIGSRYPKYLMEIVDDSGERQDLKLQRCGSTNALSAVDFIELRPGEDLDPFGIGTFRHYLFGWKPTRPGTYHVRLVYDVGTPRKPPPPESLEVERLLAELDRLLEQLGNRGELESSDPEIGKLLEATPRGRFLSNRVRFEVEE